MNKNIFRCATVIAILLLLTSVSFAGERTGVTDKEIIIGGLAPLTGPASNLGPQIVNGAMLAVKQINEKGGIYGRKITYIPGDDVCGSSQGLAIGKKLIYDHQVFALQGLSCSHVGLALRPLIESEGVPFLITMAQGPKLMNPPSKYIFRVLPSTSVTGALQGKFMWEYFKGKYKKVAILHTQEEYGSSGRDALITQLAKYGIKPLAIESHRIGDSDYSAQILKIKNSNPEVLFIQSYTRDQAVVAKQAHELGLNCILIAYLGSDYPITEGIAGKLALTKFYGPTTTYDAMTSTILKPFYDMMAKEYPEYVKNPNNPSSGDLGSYIGMQVMIKAMQAAGKDLTRSGFIKALENMEVYKTPWMPPIKFSPNQHEGQQQEQYLQFVDGKPQMLKFSVRPD